MVCCVCICAPAKNVLICCCPSQAVHLAVVLDTLEDSIVGDRVLFTEVAQKLRQSGIPGFAHVRAENVFAFVRDIKVKAARGSGNSATEENRCNTLTTSRSSLIHS